MFQSSLPSIGWSRFPGCRKLRHPEGFVVRAPVVAQTKIKTMWAGRHVQQGNFLSDFAVIENLQAAFRKRRADFIDGVNREISLPNRIHPPNLPQAGNSMIFPHRRAVRSWFLISAAWGRWVRKARRRCDLGHGGCCCGCEEAHGRGETQPRSLIVSRRITKVLGIAPIASRGHRSLGLFWNAGRCAGWSHSGVSLRMFSQLLTESNSSCL
jgi:hypothetical protein